MSDPELDEQLRRFLQHTEKSQREGNTIANVRAEVHQLSVTVRGMNGRVSTLETNYEELVERVDNHGAGLVAIKRHLRKSTTNENDESELDTGNYDLGAIRREVEAARRRESMRVRAETENVVWWKRSIITWIIAAIGFVATSAVTVLITLAIVGASTPKAPPAPTPAPARP